ncbi:MAG: hypothetical protein KJZ54_04840 [Phycisphaerales bacterium]|nr:hypothetical protein [Phycisphaerales bacterium]
MNDDTQNKPGFGSLLEGVDFRAPTKRRSARQGLNALDARLRSIARAAWRSPLARNAIGAAFLVLVASGGVGTWLMVRPKPVPDYTAGSIAAVFDFTLLTEEFNRLPVEERIRLIGQLYERMQSLSASDSAEMAAFFAGISGAAREQIERNASRLMLDVVDLAAKDYTNVPSEQREQYLADAYVRMARLTAPFDGSIDRRSDEELVTRGQRDARRNERIMRSGAVSAQDAGGMVTFMSQRIEEHATAHQRERITVFMRDLTRYLRGQDVQSGRPPG